MVSQIKRSDGNRTGKNRADGKRSDRKRSDELALWCIICVVLLVAAAILRFAMNGYDYLAYLLVCAAVLIGLHAAAPRRLVRACYLVAGILALAVCLTEIPIVSAARTTADDDTSFLIVLGARVYGDSPSLALLYRLEATLEFMQEHPDTYAVVSGGQGTDEDRPEAQTMRAWLVEHGIDESRIFTEDHATSTEENIVLSCAIIEDLGYDPATCCAIVSSSYHLYRAELLASKLGIEASGVSAYSGNIFLALNYFIREAFAVWAMAAGL